MLAGDVGVVARTAMDSRKAAMGVPSWFYLDRVRGWIADLYQAWGKPEKSAEWRTPRTP